MNIAILSTVRSGSGYVCSIFSRSPNISLYELFNHHHNETIKDWTVDRCRSLLAAKLNESKEHNKDIYIKVLHNHYLFNPHLVNEYLEKADLFIRLYRNNTLLQYISLEKAIKTKVWHKKENPSVNKDQVKIFWDIKRYLNFYNSSIATNNWIINYKKHKPSVLLTYENIHTLKDNASKLSYIRNKVQKAGFDLIFNEHFDSYHEKEGNTTNQNLLDQFTNSDDFLKCYNSIVDRLYYNREICD